jgi:2-polyprenyl-3-methyl-5-hydroxy-6-metoxy-1,4-benzoquinol methylase
MHIPGVSWALTLIREGQTRFLLAEIWMRIYKAIWEILFAIKYRVFGHLPPRRTERMERETKNPVAYESPDHQLPWGTMRDNSTNKKFVTFMAARIQSEAGGKVLGAMDLGCSGGQLVKDFLDLGWRAVGLEGSDFSLKHGRANWPELGGKNLFTCDVAKPFAITADGKPAVFRLITMWEVLEHIRTAELPQLFKNITSHLDEGGYFIASTTSETDIHEGVDLHQTRWTNREWREWVAKTFPDLEPVDLGLKYYQFVRHNSERSFLTFRKKSVAGALAGGRN